jgi:nucleoside-diphosphate-sugar epimerase
LLLDASSPDKINDHQYRKITKWIYLAPVWTLLNHLDLLDKFEAKRLVVVSSSSRFSKKDSKDNNDIALVERLTKAEEKIKAWALQAKVEWIILQPTLIYDPGKDKNISEIINFINRFGFFPLLGQANGLRQPIHASDVAEACYQALEADSVKNTSYTIAGGETLTYRKMVEKIFMQIDKPKRILVLPLSLFRCVIFCLKFFPKFNSLSPAIALRMNQDMSFDNTRAKTDFGFSPKLFSLKK